MGTDPGINQPRSPAPGRTSTPRGFNRSMYRLDAVVGACSVPTRVHSAPCRIACCGPPCPSGRDRSRVDRRRFTPRRRSGRPQRHIATKPATALTAETLRRRCADHDRYRSRQNTPHQPERERKDAKNKRIAHPLDGQLERRVVDGVRHNRRGQDEPATGTTQHGTSGQNRGRAVQPQREAQRHDHHDSDGTDRQIVAWVRSS